MFRHAALRCVSSVNRLKSSLKQGVDGRVHGLIHQYSANSVFKGRRGLIMAYIRYYFLWLQELPSPALLQFSFGHGIGRSGDITAVQPKAAGSSLVAQLTNSMLRDLIRHAGLWHVFHTCMLIVCSISYELRCFSVFGYFGVQSTWAITTSPWTRVSYGIVC